MKPVVLDFNNVINKTRHVSKVPIKRFVYEPGQNITLNKIPIKSKESEKPAPTPPKILKLEISKNVCFFISLLSPILLKSAKPKKKYISDNITNEKTVRAVIPGKSIKKLKMSIETLT